MNFQSNSAYPSLNSKQYEPPQSYVPDLKTNTYHNINSSFTSYSKPNAKDPITITNPNRRNSLTSEDKSDMISAKTTTATNMPSMTSHDFHAKTQELPQKSQFSLKTTKENEPLYTNNNGFFPPNNFLKDVNLSTQTANFDGGMHTNGSVMKTRENQQYDPTTMGKRTPPHGKFVNNNQFSSKYMPVNTNASLQNIMKANERTSFSQMPIGNVPQMGNYKKNVMSAQAELMNYDEDFLPEDCLFLLGEEDNNLASFRENVEKEKAKLVSDMDLMIKDLMNIFEENKVKLLENIDLHYKNYLTKYGFFKDMLMEFKNMKLDMPSKKLHPNFNLDLTNSSNANLIRDLEDLRYQNQMSKMFNYITALQREKLSQIINLSKELLQLSTQVPNYYNSETYTNFLKEIKGNITNNFGKRMQNINDFVKSLLPKVETLPMNPFASTYPAQNMSQFCNINNINVAEKENFNGDTPMLGNIMSPPSGGNQMFASPFPLNPNNNEINQKFNVNTNAFQEENNRKFNINTNAFQEDLKQFEATVTQGTSKNFMNNQLYKQNPSQFASSQPNNFFSKPQKMPAPQSINCMNVSTDHLSCKVSSVPQQISMELVNIYKTGHEDILLCLIAVTDDLLAVGSKDNTISLWKVSNNSKIGVLEGHKGSICSLASMKSVKGSYLFSGSDHEDGSIIVWDLQNLNKLEDCMVNKLIGHNAAVVALIALQDSQTIISGSYDKEILIWNIYSGKTIQKLAGHNSSITSLNLTKDQNKFISASLDNTINIWKLNYKENLGTKSFESCYLEKTMKNNCFICSLNCLTDSKTVVTGSKDGKIKFWNIELGETERVLTANLGPIVELLVIDSNNNDSSNNKREIMNNIVTISCSSKDQNLVFTNVSNGNNGIIDIQSKVFIEYGCGVNPKLQLIRRSEGELQMVVINQSEREKVFSVWNVKMN